MMQPVQESDICIHEQFSSWLVTALSNVAESASCTGPKRDKLLIKYHKEVSSQEFVTKWKEFACEIGVRVTALFFQHITDDLFNAILK